MTATITVTLKRNTGTGWLVTDDGGVFADYNHKYWMTADSDVTERETYYTEHGIAGIVKVVR